MATKPPIERAFERGLFAARWLMAPVYLGLAVALLMLLGVILHRAFVASVALLALMDWLTSRAHRH